MAKSNNRDDFSQATKNRLAQHAGYSCSNPSCRKLTFAPTSDDAKEVNIGVAAHICAAAPGSGARCAAATARCARRRRLAGQR